MIKSLPEHPLLLEKAASCESRFGGCYLHAVLFCKYMKVSRDAVAQIKVKHKISGLTLKDVFVAADITVPVSFGAVDAANVAISGAGGFAIA